MSRNVLFENTDEFLAPFEITGPGNDVERSAPVVPLQLAGIRSVFQRCARIVEAGKSQVQVPGLVNGGEKHVRGRAEAVVGTNATALDATVQPYRSAGAGIERSQKISALGFRLPNFRLHAGTRAQARLNNADVRVLAKVLVLPESFGLEMSLTHVERQSIVNTRDDDLIAAGTSLPADAIDKEGDLVAVKERVEFVEGRLDRTNSPNDSGPWQG